MRLTGLLIFFIGLLISCNNKPLPNREMARLLKQAEKFDYNADNIYSPKAVLERTDSILNHTRSQTEINAAKYSKALAFLQLGEEQKAIPVYEDLLDRTPQAEIDIRQQFKKDLAIAWMRFGERTNCIQHHGNQSCIFPIMLAGVHADKTGSEKAIELYKEILKEDPNDLESKWLLNICYMTTGGYPQMVPPALLIKVNDEDSAHIIRPFIDVAGNTGLNFKDMGGGSIVDDFNNDGLLDIVTSSWDLNEHMHFCRNNGNGSFADVSDSSGLSSLTGGLNMMQVDYNNDGYKDIFVLRGAWKGRFGNNPNSLLRNNGNGTFTDVTIESGILSFHPTQTATWADFNNDGWLDVFIGNETTPAGGDHPCELYINNRNGSFTNKAVQAGCALSYYVKGVSSGDYDHDGLSDIFISALDGHQLLLKNVTAKNGPVKFVDVTKAAGFGTNSTRSFPTWFWDYDNDGWLDILYCGYEFYEPLAWYAAAEAINAATGKAGKIFLYHNNHDGTFEDVSARLGLNKIGFAMGANFGDIDNDGYLDFYLGTGNPKLKSLIPNKLFRNEEGNHFMDITTAARVGNLQKGHGISFADLDSDGDEDIYIEMGGAYTGDAYENSLYLNPGQNSNNWINIRLEGVSTNRSAIGASIKLSFNDSGKERSVYRDVNSGGSFGSSPLRQHFGIGKASSIKRVEITWPVTGKIQVLENLPINANISIKEGEHQFKTYRLPLLDFLSTRSGLIPCKP